MFTTNKRRYDMTHIVIRQSWTEYERGWGQKPWSHTLHLNQEDMERFNAAYWSSKPDAVPDWYIAPDKNPTPVTVSDELYEQLLTQADDLTGNRFKGKGIWNNSQPSDLL
jgi:hypothetical protein